MSAHWSLTGSPNGMLTAHCKRCPAEATYPNYSDVNDFRREHDKTHDTDPEEAA